MTGYGRAQGEAGLGVEIRTVNHRHLDANCRLPKAWGALESAVKGTISRYFSRGRVELSVVFERNAEHSGFEVDQAVVEGYLKAVEALPQGGPPRTLDVATLLTLPGAVVPSSTQLGPEDGQEPLLAAVAEACEAVTVMRRREGAALAEELTARMDGIQEAVSRVAERRPVVMAEVLGRLRARVSDLVADVELDEARLAHEVALLADRTDISEEITRLGSHMAQFHEALQGGKPVGRTMDFLVVEMNREVNTIGAKCQDAEMVADVVLIKGELEKVREQVQNVE
jgi:uncharacterized protein (TIGR00255 family)